MAARARDHPRRSTDPSSIERHTMIYWAVVFFVVAIIAAIFGFSGIAHDSAYIGKILAVIAIILAVVSYLSHRNSNRS
jgi:uncharacterized membrane protein YtjA (UPF0391 family)